MKRRHFCAAAGLLAATRPLGRPRAQQRGLALKPVARADGAWRLFEDRTRPDGALTIVAPDGRVRTLSRTLEQAGGTGARPYCGLSFPTLAYAEHDLLAERLLAGGGDPDPARVRDAAPPIDSRVGPEQIGRLAWTSFVGPVAGRDVMPITPAGSTRNWHVNGVVPELGFDAATVRARREGLLGGALPIIVKQFPLSADRYWELVVFAEPVDDAAQSIPTWQRMTLVDRGQVVRSAYAGAYVAFGPFRQPPSEEAFNAALLRCVLAWEDELRGTLVPRLPQPDWADLARHAFVKEAMTRQHGLAPRYGVVDRDYGGPEYDGFQDIFTASLLANLDWGRHAQAKALLDDQFTRYVGDDGLVAMRGPEVGQTGLTLALIAHYVRLTGDVETLRRHRARIVAMAGVLTALEAQATARPATDPGYGLIHGWSESDACLFPDPSVWWKPYFSNSAMASRGLADLAAIWPRVAAHGEDGMRAWSACAARLRTRLVQSLRASVRHDLDPPYVPILPGVRETFRDSLSRHKISAQQWAHRVYSELLLSGVLPPDLEAMTIASMRAHGATVMGVVGNLAAPSREARDMLGFISYGYALALLRQDRIEEFVLFLYAHRYHAHTRGSWTAAEVAGLKGELALYCLPAQMTIPILLRRALVQEDEAAETLHLARGVPRAWLDAAGGIAIDDVPTRWGTVGFEIRLAAARDRMACRISLPPDAPVDVRLYLRLPADLRPVRISSGAGTLDDHVLRLDGHGGGDRRLSLLLSAP